MLGARRVKGKGKEMNFICNTCGIFGKIGGMGEMCYGTKARSVQELY